MPMRNFTLFFLFILLFSTALSAQVSPQLPQPKVWLRADLGGLKPAFWPDESGNQFHASAMQGEGASPDTMLNFNPVRVFDGEKTYLQIPYSLEGEPELTIFTVFQSADTTERGVWGAEKGLSRKVLLSTRRAKGPEGVLDEYGKHENRPVLHTLVQNWNETLEVSQEAFLALGSAGREQDTLKAFKGLIAEVMVFDQVLSFMERIQVQTYLSIKYGIPLQEGNYVSSAEVLLWNAEENKEYAHRISGLGRDDAFKLYQKQARSALDSTGLLLLSAGKAAASNERNSALISNGDFLLWGDNGQGLTDKPGQGKDSILSVLERKWLMKVSGSSASQLPTQLQLKLSQLAADSLGYWLVIDRSGQGDFSVDKLEYIAADSVSADSIAYYSNLRWDSDGSGKDMFGFARAQHMLVLLSELQHPNCDSLSAGRARIEVIGGQGPFSYVLRNAATGFSRSWEAAETSAQDSLAAGTYMLTVKGKDGHEKARTFALALPNSLHVDLGQDQVLNEGSAITLDASAYIADSIPVSYQWESSYGFQSSEPRVNIKETGIYKVTVSNAEGCLFSDEIIISGSVAQRFAVFPSPVKGGHEFSISVSLEEPGQVNLGIYHLNGHLYQQMRGDNSAEFHFKGRLQDPGIYTVVLSTPKGTEAKKIIVH
jgi:hypothetical protein